MARTALHLTQEDAAERIGVSKEFYGRIETGRSLPSILTFARIVSGLGASSDTLLGRTAEHQYAPVNMAPAEESPEIRRLVRRLRRAGPSALRLVNLLLKELEMAQ
jgi:transcriptional regulator with XRE-family HTH domain